MLNTSSKDTKKKKGLLPLKEKMGLDKTTNYHSPEARHVPGSAEADLNERENPTMGDRIRSRIEERKGGSNAQT